MSSTIVYPNGDGSKGGWTDDGGGTTNIYSKISEGTASPNDANYVLTATPNDAVYFLLGDMPGDFGDATAVTIKIRAACSWAKTDWLQTLTARLVQSDESTAITAVSSNISTTETIATFSVSPTITGATGKSAWDGARLKISSANETSGGILYVYASQVEINYTVGGGGGYPNGGQAMNTAALLHAMGLD